MGYMYVIKKLNFCITQTNACFKAVVLKIFSLRIHFHS